MATLPDDVMGSILSRITLRLQRKRGMTSRAKSSIERRTRSCGRPPKFSQQSTSPAPSRCISAILAATGVGRADGQRLGHELLPRDLTQPLGHRAKARLQQRMHAADVVGDEEASRRVLVPHPDLRNREVGLSNENRSAVHARRK
jgi:hypothetical protein